MESRRDRRHPDVQTRYSVGRALTLFSELVRRGWDAALP